MQREKHHGDKAPGFLRKTLVSALTQSRYFAAFLAFVVWTARKLSESAGASSTDAWLVEYIEFLYLSGESPAAARYALYGTCFQKDLNSRDPAISPLSKKTLKAFVKKDPEHMRDPAPLEVVWFAANWLFSLHTVDGLLAAAFLLIAFDCYLRPTEGLDLEREHVTPPRRNTNNKFWSLVIYPVGGNKPAKNQQFDCGVTAGAHGRDWLPALLEALYKRAKPKGKLFRGLTLAKLDRLLSEFSEATGLKLVAHMVRHSGPSHDAFYFKVPIEDIRVRGRWVCVESCRRYMKPAMLLRALGLLDNEGLDVANRAAETLVPKIRKAIFSLPAA